jgi:hypothetical protein
MRSLIIATLAAALLSGGCAERQPADGYQPQRPTFSHYRYRDYHHRLQPRYSETETVAGDYHFVPARRYEGRGQVSRYQWIRQ